MLRAKIPRFFHFNVFLKLQVHRLASRGNSRFFPFIFLKTKKGKEKTPSSCEGIIKFVRFQDTEWTMFCRTGAFWGFKRSVCNYFWSSPFPLCGTRLNHCPGKVTDLPSLSLPRHTYRYRYIQTHMHMQLHPGLSDYCFARPVMSRPLWVNIAPRNIYQAWLTGHNIGTLKIFLWFLIKCKNNT